VTPDQFEQVKAHLASRLEVGTSRVEGKGALHFFKTSDPPDLNVIRALLPKVQVELLQPVLPVVTRPERKPQLFDTMTRWREIAAERQLPLWEVAVQYERDASGWTREQVLAYMRLVARKMHRQTHAIYEENVAVPISPFKPNLAAMWSQRISSPGRLTDDVTANTLKWAFGAGAGIPGVETVPGPMGSGGGYIYAALCAVQDAHGFTDQDVLRGLFIAAGIGAIAYTRTEPTGECIGCTGECGVCGAMAAAAIAEMAGGTPEQVENAASLSLQAMIGLPCDPIPGGLSQPCRSRVLSAACTAHVFADLALAGRDAVLPLHEVIDAADKVGRQLPPELLCTSRGGAAATPTARKQAAAYRVWFDQTIADNTPRPPGNLI
jgi:L-serine dehydratase